MCIKTNVLDQLVQFFRKSGYVKVVLVALGLSQLISLFFGLSRHYFGHLNIYFFTSPLQQGNSLASMVLSDAIIAPILETLIFQWFIYNVLKRFKFFRTNVKYIILFSAFLFGAAHCYDILYMIFAFFIGLIYMAVFVSKLDNTKLAFWLVALIHVIDNSITVSLFWLSGSVVS